MRRDGVFFTSVNLLTKNSNSVQTRGCGVHTREDGRRKELGNRRRVELQVPLVIVERPVLASRLQRPRVGNHPGVEGVEVRVGGYTVYHHETVVVDASYGLFEVAGAEALGGQFLGGGGYHGGEAGCLGRIGPALGEGPGDIAGGL